MRIERVEEWKAQTSYNISGGTTQTLSNMHVARMILQVAGPPTSPPGYTTVTVSGVPTAIPWTLDNYSYTIGALSPGQEGVVISGGPATPAATNIPTSWSSTPIPGNFNTSPGVSVALSAYGEVPIQVSATGPFSPTINATLGVNVGFHISAHYTDPNTGSRVNTSSGVYTNYSLNLMELLQSGSAIDTRRAFGQPNLAGELPADPNAPARAVDFTSWTYSGGQFVGSMPAGSTTDESGLARMQFWGGTGGSGTCLAATASLLDMGSRTTPTGAETVGIYIPSSSDPNLGSGPGALTWTGAWTITPSSGRSSPVNYWQTPVSTLTLSATNTTDYLNWIIADTYGSGYVIPSSVFNHMAFALTDETTGPSWHYFGSMPYTSIATTFPGTDSRPRVWWVGLVGTPTNWTAPS